MALPAVLLKAKEALTTAQKAKQVKDAVQSSSSTENGGLRLSPLIFSMGFMGVFVLLLILMIPLLIVSSLGTTFELQAVDSAYADEWKNGSGVDLNYDFEALYEASVNAPISPNSPATDLASTEYGNVSGFNDHIKDCVEEAGYGTRAGVVAAGKCLISDYTEATGYRLRYSMPNRGSSEMEGIRDDTYFDCSSFAWWALYNGGFNIPCYNTTPNQVSWALDYGIATKEYTEAQAGDFLIYDQGGGANGHARLIIGTYDDGVYIAEFSSGGQISKTAFSDIPDKYYLVQMEKYYSDTSNVR